MEVMAQSIQHLPNVCYPAPLQGRKDSREVMVE